MTSRWLWAGATMRNQTGKNHGRESDGRRRGDEPVDFADQDPRQRFGQRSRNAQKSKIEKTSQLRAADAVQAADLDALPIGQVVQVYSLFCQVEHETGSRLCVKRKTMEKLALSRIVVGDFVRFRDQGSIDPLGRQEAVIEAVLPRRTVLTRTDDARTSVQRPIVANAEQMLIVASVVQPGVKWGLIDRMIVAAQGGGLLPIVCLNKIDLAGMTNRTTREMEEAQQNLAHYESIGVRVVQTSASLGTGIDRVKELLKDRITVLAGHSGVGKSTLIATVEPGLDIRVAEISAATQKGKHTTTSARRYQLSHGGYVIDTPGVKLFGIWGLTRQTINQFFPDIQNDSAPPWRKQSYERIYESLPHS